MRTTLNIDDELLKQAKVAAVREGISLTELVERALALSTGAEPKVAKGAWKAITFPGKPIPGFDWSASYSKMIEFLEGPDARP